MLPRPNPVEKEEVSATFEIFLNRSTGKKSRWKQFLCCGLLVIAILGIISFIAYYVSDYYKLDQLVFAPSSSFDNQIRIQDWLIEPVETDKDSLVVMIGGYSNYSNNESVPTSSLEILAGNISDCPTLPANLFTAFTLRSHISGINDAGVLGSCSHDIQFATATKCRIYNPYNLRWDDPVSGSRGSKFAEEFVGLSVGKSVILQDHAGGFVDFNLQSRQIIRPAQVDEISSGPMDACYIVLSDDETILTGGKHIEGNFTKAVISLKFQAERIQRTPERHFPNLLSARGDHGCGQFLQNGKLYLIVAGGSTNSAAGGSVTRSVEILSVQAPTNSFDFWAWESMGQLSEPRRFFPTVAVLNKTLVLAGGVGSKNPLSVEVFDTLTSSWVVSEHLHIQEPRHSHTTAFMKKGFCDRVKSRKQTREQFIWRAGFAIPKKKKKKSESSA